MIRISRHSIAVPLMLALGACVTDYTKSEAPNNLRVDGAETRVELSFVPGSARLTPPDAIQQFSGSIVRVPVAAGQPIYDPFVVSAKGSGFLAATLPKGMRAVAVSISPESGAGGFILPEDHVDILLTRHDKVAEKASGNEQIVTDTILRNVRVLAVDQTVEDKNGQKVVIAKTATLELLPQQAETLEAAHLIGTLSLSLRGLVDSQSATPEGAEDKSEKATLHTVRYGVRSMSTVDR